MSLAVKTGEYVDMSSNIYFDFNNYNASEDFSEDSDMFIEESMIEIETPM